jgi:acetolactate synthase-1/2/3 large subunit
MEAASMGIPLLLIGGAVAMNMRDAGDLQDMDTLRLMTSCSKWAKRINSTARIPEYVSMAFRHAMEPSPGPVYLEIPTDLLAAKLNEEDIDFPVNYRANGIPQGDPALVNTACRRLRIDGEAFLMRLKKHCLKHIGFF